MSLRFESAQASRPAEARAVDLQRPLPPRPPAAEIQVGSARVHGLTVTRIQSESESLPVTVGLERSS
jgi:hypothetical protein